MAGLLKRRSVLERKQRDVRRAMADVDGRIRILRRRLRRSGVSAELEAAALGYRIELALRPPAEWSDENEVRPRRDADGPVRHKQGLPRERPSLQPAGTAGERFERRRAGASRGSDSDASGAPSARKLQAVRDERFADYLASSLASAGPLRHERHIQRNRAVVMLVVVGLALLWVLFRFLL